VEQGARQLSAELVAQLVVVQPTLQVEQAETATELYLALVAIHSSRLVVLRHLVKAEFQEVVVLAPASLPILNLVLVDVAKYLSITPK
jgi:hypothetical protein